MNVEPTYSGAAAVARVSGRIDSASAKDFNDALNAVLGKGVTALVLDCSGLRYLSSAGLRVLLIAIRKTTAAGGGLALSGVPPHIREVLEVSGFVRLAKVFETSEEAQASLSG